ncbi:hypothetical protein [Streptomyces sp. G44]|uniref:hypothetical protein n=1 Tax=Streptomyces sp. G44 TaxID=2807632 RepID=UPI00196128A7|nr:hypothetical protein [Streptomyces sp. G44]
MTCARPRETRGYRAPSRADGARESWSRPRVALRWSERRLEPEVELSEAMLDDLEQSAHPARAAQEPPGQRVADSPT